MDHVVVVGGELGWAFYDALIFLLLIGVNGRVGPLALALTFSSVDVLLSVSMMDSASPFLYAPRTYARSSSAIPQPQTQTPALEIAPQVGA